MLKELKMLKIFCKNSCARFDAVVLFSAWRP
jgi:hypothetical protein